MPLSRICLIILFLSGEWGFAQHHSVLDFQRKPILTHQPLTSFSPQNDSLISVIIRFKQAGTIVQKATATSDFWSAEQLQSQFLSDYQTLEGSTFHILSQPVFYEKTIQAAHVWVHTSNLTAFSSLPYVENVEQNAIVYAHSITQELEALYIPQFREESDTYLFGEGITIGVLDSGVDYTHEALGGGFGEGFKVSMGYDFVDKDADPMDENGHGTHVAGILAADSDFMQGVAPKANIAALRVLNHRGQGTSADILEALEWVADPNGDGDPSDHLAIINLSLGLQGGDPRDALCTAVNNLTDLGVLCVISAGNSGFTDQDLASDAPYAELGAQTVGSPGMAERALTVGSVSLSGNLSPFSSKGPTPYSFSIKPDVLAPGEHIQSSWLNNSYQTKSGTSMAAPFVSGMAALLKQKYPHSSALELKQMLIQSSVSKGFRAFQEGSGMVNMQGADQHSLIFSQSQLSFGMNPDSGAYWVKKKTISVRNAGQTPETIAIRINGMQPGISLSVVPQSVTLSPDNSVEIEVILSVDNSIISNRNDDIRLFDGDIRITSSLHPNVRLPWLFTRSSVMRIHSDTPNPDIILFDETRYVVSGFHSNFNFFNRISEFESHIYGLPKKPVHVALQLDETVDEPAILFYENLPWKSSHHVSYSDATLFIRHELNDTDAVSLYHYPIHTQRLGLYLPLGAGVITATKTQSEHKKGFRINPISSAHNLRFDILAMDNHRVVFPFLDDFSGLASSKVFDHTSVQWQTNVIQFQSLESITDHALLLEMPLFVHENQTDLKFSTWYEYQHVSSLNNHFTIEILTSKPQGNSEVFSSPSFTLMKPVSETRYDFLIESEPLSFKNDSLVFASPQFFNRPLVPHGANDTLYLGLGFTSMTNLSRNAVYGEQTIFLNPILRGMNREIMHELRPHVTYQLMDSNAHLFASGDFSSGFQPIPAPTERAQSKLLLRGETLANEPVHVQFFQTFDFTKSSANPPTPFMIQVVNGEGKLRDRFSLGETPRVSFTSAIPLLMRTELPNPDKTVVEYKRLTDSEWQQAEVHYSLLEFRENSFEGYHFWADLTHVRNWDDAGVELRIRLVDPYENESIQHIRPAFALGNWQGDQGTPIEDSFTLPKQVTLFQNYPNPFNPSTTLAFEIPRFSEVHLEVFDSLGRLVQRLVGAELAAGKHQVTFDANRLASGLYFYRLQVGNEQFVRKMMLIK